MALSIEIGDGNYIINKQEYNNGEITIRFYFNDVHARVGDELEIGQDLTNYIPFAYRIIGHEDISRGYLETKIDVASIVSNDKFTLEVQVADYENTRVSKEFTLVYAPESSNDEVSTLEDNPLVLGMGDFGTFGENLTSTDGIEVRIDTLPANGQLLFNGNVVSAGDVISASDVQNGKLVFKPIHNTDANGDFKFSLAEDGEWSEKSYDLSIDIKAVADAPIVTTDTNVDINPPADGQGLTLSVYDCLYAKNIYSTDYMQNGNNLRALSNTIEGESKVITDFNGVATDTLNCSTMVAYKGLVYLEAGQKVTFSGSVDDTAMIMIGGHKSLYTSGDAYGDFNTENAGVTYSNSKNSGEFHSGGEFVVEASGYYTLDTYVFNSSGCGNYDIKMSVDGGNTYKAITPENFNLYSSVEALDATLLAQHGSLVAYDGTNTGFYPVNANVGLENSPIKLSDIDVNLVDKDSSESISSLAISSIPVGAVLTDGTHTFTSTNANQKANITDWNIDNLSIKAPKAGNYDLVIEATSKEQAADAAVAEAVTTNKEITVTVNGASQTPADPSIYTPQACAEYRDLHEDVTMTKGDDYLVVGDDIGSLYNRNVEVKTLAGNDSIEVDGAIDFNAKVDMGKGDDQMNVGLGGIIGKSNVDMGSGDDLLNVQGYVSAQSNVDMGSGNDHMRVNGYVDRGSSIDMGKGNDKFEVADDLSVNYLSEAKVDGGSGEDTYILTRPGALIDLTHIAEHADNFEKLDVSSWNVTNVKLNVNDIIEFTDERNTLIIDGDNLDKVSSDKAWSWDTWTVKSVDSWNYEGSENGYDKYVGTDSSGRTATLLVEDVIATDF